MCTPLKAKPTNQHPAVCCRGFFLNCRSKTKPPESEVKCLCTSCGYFHIHKRCLCVSHASISIRVGHCKYMMEDGAKSLTNHLQLTTCINLTLWAYHPIYLLQMPTNPFTSLLQSPQASISPPFFLLLLLACLLFHQQLQALYLPRFNKGLPPLPFLQLLLCLYCTDTFCRTTMLTGSKTDPAREQFCSFWARSIPWHREAGMAHLGKGSSRSHCRNLDYHWTAA